MPRIRFWILNKTFRFSRKNNLTATVAPSVASGTVTFSGGAWSTTCLLVAGTCSVTTTSLPSGNVEVVATYGGDTNYAASTSAATAVTVPRVTSSLSLSGGGSTSTYGDTVTFTVTVSTGDGTATGTVSLSDGSATVGTCSLTTGGACVVISAALTAGDHLLVARYAGDANRAPSASAAPGKPSARMKMWLKRSAST